MFTGYHQCSEDLVACVQTNLINYSNLGGGRLASLELKCHCLDLLHHEFWVMKEALAAKIGMWMCHWMVIRHLHCQPLWATDYSQHHLPPMKLEQTHPELFSPTLCLLVLTYTTSWWFSIVGIIGWIMCEIGGTVHVWSANSFIIA